MKVILLSISLLLLSACSSQYSFNSNINRDAITDYYKAANVTLYQQDQTPSAPFSNIAILEAQSCQINHNDPAASDIAARTKLREQAANKGANAIIVKRCMEINDPSSGCISQVICMGQAIKEIKQ